MKRVVVADAVAVVGMGSRKHIRKQMDTIVTCKKTKKKTLGLSF